MQRSSAAALAQTPKPGWEWRNAKEATKLRLELEMNMYKLITSALIALLFALSLASSVTSASAQVRGYDRGGGYAPGYEDKAYNRDGW
jgi:hypothetical protein